MIAELTSKETGVIGSPSEVSVVAHRVVHGGEKFTEATLITDEVLAEIETLNPLAPLHNPVIVAGIREMRRCFPLCRMWGCSILRFITRCRLTRFSTDCLTSSTKRKRCVATAFTARHMTTLHCGRPNSWTKA